MTNRQIAETFPPGVFLEEELEVRGWSQLDFAEIIGKSPRDINLIINGKLSITPKTAIVIGEALGTSPQLWMNLESAYQLSQADKESNEIALKAKLYEKFPVREMIKRGWIKPSNNIKVLIARFCEYFEIDSLDDEPSFSHADRKSTNTTTAIQNAWLFRARQLAKVLPVTNKFSQTRLKTCLDKLRLLLHEPAEIRHIPKVLSEAGIRMVIVEPMPKSKIDGSTFWLDDDSPVIVLSLLHDRIDNFWFTLMHELSHVKNGEGKVDPILDMDLLSADGGVDDRPEFEKRADRDAAEFCIPKVALDSFITRTRPYYLEWKIKGFAEVNKVCAGVVVGQLQKREEILYSHHRKLLTKVREIINEPALVDGYGYTPSI